MSGWVGLIMLFSVDKGKISRWNWFWRVGGLNAIFYTCLVYVDHTICEPRIGVTDRRFLSIAAGLGDGGSVTVSV